MFYMTIVTAVIIQLYSDYRTRDEYYGGQSQNLQPDNGAHLYSVSQRLPPAPPYSPLGRHDDWGSQRQLPVDGKENSLESLEKQSAAGQYKIFVFVNFLLQLLFIYLYIFH